MSKKKQLEFKSYHHPSMGVDSSRKDKITATRVIQEMNSVNDDSNVEVGSDNRHAASKFYSKQLSDNKILANAMTEYLKAQKNMDTNNNDDNKNIEENQNDANTNASEDFDPMALLEWETFLLDELNKSITIQQKSISALLDNITGVKLINIKQQINRLKEAQSSAKKEAKDNVLAKKIPKYLWDTFLQADSRFGKVWMQLTSESVEPIRQDSRIGRALLESINHNYDQNNTEITNVITFLAFLYLKQRIQKLLPIVVMSAKYMIDCWLRKYTVLMDGPNKSPDAVYTKWQSEYNQNISYWIAAEIGVMKKILSPEFEITDDLEEAWTGSIGIVWKNLIKRYVRTQHKQYKQHYQ
eukprot:371470_1